MKQKQYKVNTRTKGEREQKIKVKNQEVFEDSGPYAHAKMERRALPNGMPTGKGYHFSGKRARCPRRRRPAEPSSQQLAALCVHGSRLLPRRGFLWVLSWLGVAVLASGGGEEDGKVTLGGSGVAVTKLGIGAWSWGDTTYWNEFQWDDRKLKAAKGAFDASVDCGITFFDTAEVYGAGVSGAINSESLLGRFIKERQQKEPVEVAIATKFAALPWRLGRGSVISALKASLDRLGVSSVELYQLHWPGIWGNEGYLDGLGDAYEQGLVKAVGVSNYSEKRLRDAYERLKKRGVPLASNQVNYSLIYRNPEENGVKAACDELGITLIAYSPIAQGALTGKYTPENPPTGPRGRIYTPEFLTKLEPLINRIKEIGGTYGRTPTQVVLNWLVCQGNVVPIPGAKNAEQAREFAGALGWSLTEQEVEELRSMAREVKPVIGFPVEKL